MVFFRYPDFPKKRYRKVIIVQIKGGLGNQMFQYAAARGLSERLKTTLKLDTTFFENNLKDVTERDFELDKLTIGAPIASGEEIKKIKNRKGKNIFRITQIRERHYPILKPFLKTQHNYYMKGYWQREDYFADIAPAIREEFRFSEALTDDYFIRIQKEINETNSVSLHFRRGDYVSNAKVNACFGTCPLSYYEEAVKFVLKKTSTPRLFVFSDDIDWVKANFRTQLPVVFVDKKDENRHSDFRLMSMCHHNIIANSSYSWWAAWLNSNPEKTVIAPQQWSKDKQLQRLSFKMIPKNWIRI